MRFNALVVVQYKGAMGFRPKVVALSLMLSLCILFALLGMHQSNAQSGSAAQATEAATPSPTSQPLILLWQANVAPDDLVDGANFITLDTLGNCYVDSDQGLPVKEFDANGKMVATWGSQGKGDGEFTYETGIAVDAQGNLYVADVVNVRIEKFDNKGNFVTSWTTEAPAGPTGIGIDSKGNIYVANHHPHDHYIQKFDSTGKLLNQWGSTGTGDGQFMAEDTSGIVGLAVDKQDNVYVTDPLNHRIQKFDSNGKYLSQFGSAGVNGNGQFNNLVAVAADAQGNIYASDGSYLQKFDPNGNLIAQWSEKVPHSDLDRANFVAVDAQGNIYVTAHATITTAKGRLDMLILKKLKQPS